MYFMSDPQALHVTRNVIPGKLGVDLHLHRVHIPLVCCCFAVYSLRMNGWSQTHCCWTPTSVWECTSTAVGTCGWPHSHGASYTPSVVQWCLTSAISCSVQSQRFYCHASMPYVLSLALRLESCFSRLLIGISSLLMIVSAAQHRHSRLHWLLISFVNGICSGRYYNSWFWFLSMINRGLPRSWLK